MATERFVSALAAAVMLAACGEGAVLSPEPASRDGGGGARDVGEQPVPRDAAEPVDAPDAAERADASPGADASVAADASDPGPDAATPPDAAVAGPDAGAGECAPSASESRPCGACGSGAQTRTCEPDERWGSWSGCAGEETGFPTAVATGAPSCPPYTRPAVFFAPHPDDETLAMAGAIREHLNAGRSVFVEVLTRGTGSGVRGTLSDGRACSWHGGTHAYTLTPDQLGDARIREFKDSMGRLGVTGIHVSDFPDGALTAAQVTQRLSFWLARNDPGLSLKGVAGAQDPATAGGSPHPDHATLWNTLANSGFTDVRGYLVSHYRTQAGAPDWTTDISASCAAKRDALDAYKVWDPSAGRYAIGYHSVESLFDLAASDCHEYVVAP